MSASHRDSQGRPIVAVTGIGIITSLGQGKDANWQALTAGRSGIHRIERFPTEGLRTSIAATVDFLFDRPFAAPELSEKLATLAAEEAVTQSGLGTPGDFPGELFMAVPPVETNSTPNAASSRARSTSPVLSETEISARPTWTWFTAAAGLCICGPPGQGRDGSSSRSRSRMASGVSCAFAKVQPILDWKSVSVACRTICRLARGINRVASR